LEPSGAIGSKDHVCADCSSTQPFAVKDRPPRTYPRFLTVVTPIAGRAMHPEGVRPGHGSLGNVLVSPDLG
jgi:hypothetical protein